MRLDAGNAGNVRENVFAEKTEFRGKNNPEREKKLLHHPMQLSLQFLCHRRTRLSSIFEFPIGGKRP